jgi:hypothetical protein
MPAIPSPSITSHNGDNVIGLNEVPPIENVEDEPEDDIMDAPINDNTKKEVDNIIEKCRLSGDGFATSYISNDLEPQLYARFLPKPINRKVASLLESSLLDITVN